MTHLGRILTSTLSDANDIKRATSDLCRQANSMLRTFAPCDPAVKTRLFHLYCLSLYGSTIWFLNTSQLHSLEVYFNNVIRNLPRHTRTLHLVAGLQSAINSIAFS